MSTDRHVLIARLDSEGDVLLAGPAIRAVSVGSARVTLLCGPGGRAAACLLPGVDDTLVWTAPWIVAEPEPIRAGQMEDFVASMRERAVDAALVLSSYHQSPLPLALLLRMAGVEQIAAISEDYPGSLLDVRHRVADDLPEAERALSLARAAGYQLPPGDDGRLRVRPGLPPVQHLQPAGRYVVVHPGASVPARALPPEWAAEMTRALGRAGRRVLVTGSPGEVELTARVAGKHASDLGGRTSLAELAALLAGADALVVGNTGPAHLAAAVATPVVSLFAPTVPFTRWRPYGVPCVRLGDPRAPCRDTRARVCQLPEHPCLESVPTADVVAAVAELTRSAA
ncbi:glycosyltransferase family 9 protein [soil metagenome]